MWITKEYARQRALLRAFSMPFPQKIPSWAHGSFFLSTDYEIVVAPSVNLSLLEQLKDSTIPLHPVEEMLLNLYQWEKSFTAYTTEFINTFKINSNLTTEFILNKFKYIVIPKFRFIIGLFLKNQPNLWLQFLLAENINSFISFCYQLSLELKTTDHTPIKEILDGFHSAMKPLVDWLATYGYRDHVMLNFIRKHMGAFYVASDFLKNIRTQAILYLQLAIKILSQLDPSIQEKWKQLIKWSAMSENYTHVVRVWTPLLKAKIGFTKDDAAFKAALDILSVPTSCCYIASQGEVVVSQEQFMEYQRSIHQHQQSLRRYLDCLTPVLDNLDLTKTDGSWLGLQNAKIARCNLSGSNWPFALFTVAAIEETRMDNVDLGTTIYFDSLKKIEDKRLWHSTLPNFGKPRYSLQAYYDFGEIIYYQLGTFFRYRPLQSVNSGVLYIKLTRFIKCCAYQIKFDANIHYSLFALQMGVTYLPVAFQLFENLQKRKGLLPEQRKSFLPLINIVDQFEFLLWNILLLLMLESPSCERGETLHQALIQYQWLKDMPTYLQCILVKKKEGQGWSTTGFSQLIALVFSSGMTKDNRIQCIVMGMIKILSETNLTFYYKDEMTDYLDDHKNGSILTPELNRSIASWAHEQEKCLQQLAAIPTLSEEIKKDAVCTPVKNYVVRVFNFDPSFFHTDQLQPLLLNLWKEVKNALPVLSSTRLSVR